MEDLKSLIQVFVANPFLYKTTLVLDFFIIS